MFLFTCYEYFEYVGEIDSCAPIRYEAKYNIHDISKIVYVYMYVCMYVNLLMRIFLTLNIKQSIAKTFSKYDP